VREIELCLLYQPTFGASSENLGQPNSHLGRYTAFLVHQFGQSGALHSKGCCCGRYSQPQWLDTFAKHKATGVGWILHRHGPISSLMVVHIIDFEGMTVLKPEHHAPVRANRHGPHSPHITLKRMQPKSGNGHVCNCESGIKPCQDIAQLKNMLCHDSAIITVLE